MNKRGTQDWINKILLIMVISLTIGIIAILPASAQDASSDTDHPEVCDSVTIHYRRRNTDYDGWGLHVWGSIEEDVTWEDPMDPVAEDDYGIYWEVNMAPDSKSLNYIIHKGDEKDPGPDQVLVFSETGCSIWLVQGKEDQFTNPEDGLDALEVKIVQVSEIGDDQVLIHYRRLNEDYDGWGLHIWGPTAVEGVTWGSPHQPAGQDEYGIYWVVEMEDGHSLRCSECSRCNPTDHPTDDPNDRAEHRSVPGAAHQKSPEA